MLDRIIQRIVRIIRLDTAVYREIQHDPRALGEAALVVAVASLLAALGAGLGAPRFLGGFAVEFLAGVLLYWLLWSAITMLVGTRAFGSHATFAEVARPLGYANGSRALGILSIVGCIFGPLVGLAAWVLSLVIGVIAVREAMELTTERAIVTAMVGWVVVVLARILLADAL
jgi:hypothetical protein